MTPSNFDLKAMRAKAQIDDALGIKPAPPQQPNPVQAQLGPMGGQRPAGAPNPGAPFGAPPTGAPQPQPMAGQFGGMQGGAQVPLAGGQLGVSGSTGPNMQLQQLQAQYSKGPVNASVRGGPGGFQGAGVGASAPVAGGHVQMGADVDQRMKLAQLFAQFQKGGFGAGLQYAPGQGVSGGVQYRKPFQEGGLAVLKGK